MEDLAARHQEFNLAKDDRFKLTLSGLKAKGDDDQVVALLGIQGKMGEEQVRELMKASDTLVLEHLELPAVQNLELQLREHGLGYQIELEPCAPGGHSCTFHSDRPDVGRCVTCNSFVCAQCRATANQMTICPRCRGRISEALEAQVLTPGRIATGFAAAALAAAVGGLIWGGICVSTNYEIGYVAWGLGWLSGVAVVAGARGGRGPILQVAAVAASVLGILVGKYIMFFAIFSKIVAAKAAAGTAAGISYLVLLSPGFFKLFCTMLPKILGGFDLLWCLLAVSTAWSMPAAAAVRIEEGAS